MDDLLYRQVGQGALVLTVNNRLARHLQNQYDRARRDAGALVWPRAEIMSLSGWLNGQQAELNAGPAVLSTNQSLRVWEIIIEQETAQRGSQLLQVPQTARRAHQAHQLLIRHAADFSAGASAEDHRAFLRWRERWRQTASRKHWLDSAELIWLVAEAIDRQTLPAPGHVILAGFDQLTPDLRRLRRALREQGGSVAEWQAPPATAVDRLRVAALDPANEVRCCARWARRILDDTPSASIGIVVPQLDAYQSLLDTVLTAELDPSAVLAGQEIAETFNISLGRRLDREGPVHAAQRLLQLTGVASMDEISWLLRSPYVGRVPAESCWRASLDVELRRQGQVDWPLSRLCRAIGHFARRSGKIDIQVGQVFSLLAKDVRVSSKKMPGDWAEHFTRLLRNLGWPGERGLSSREYQAVEAFADVLSAMASLDPVSPPVSRTVALGILGRLASQAEFQPESPEGVIQVLGLLEAAGLSFDHLWVLGLHDAALPQPPGPNPFIPLALQREYRMPRTDAERERLFAEQVGKRLFSAAPQVCLSWPQQVDGLERRPSPLLAGVAEGLPRMADSVDPTSLLELAGPAPEQLADARGPAINSRKSFNGGTGILKDQALCPFRAFGHYRLRAERIETPEIGLNNMSRGSLVHAALECFWKETGDHPSLVKLTGMDLEERIERSVLQALRRFEKENRRDLPPRLRHLEKQRLVALVGRWLQIEQRRPPFRVEGAEISRKIAIGNLRIRTRIDRIDKLEDGSLAVLDYKTGRPDPGQWLDDRVTEPQLPVYCLDLPRQQVAAVLFAVVRAKRREAGFRGLAREPDDWPGLNRKTLLAGLEEKGWESFDAVLEHWQTVLTDLAEAFTGGVAAVDPVSYEAACQYCDLTPLCRINDLGDQAPLPEGQHD